MSVAAPSDLLDLLDQHGFDPEPGAIVWFLELSAQKYSLFIVQRSRFGVYAEIAASPAQAYSFNRANLRRDLDNILEIPLENHPPKAVVLLGELTTETQAVESYLKAPCFVLAGQSLPRFSQLREYLRECPAVIKVQLEVVTLDSDSLASSTISSNQQYHLNLRNLLLSEPQTEVYTGGYIGKRITVYAPSVGTEMRVFITERNPKTRQASHQRVYTVMPTQQVVTLRAVFKGLDWDIHWEGINPTYTHYKDYPRPHLDDDGHDGYPVKVEVLPPRFLIVVEAALGMRLLSEKLNNREGLLEGDFTDFATVQKLVEHITTIFRTWDGHLMFYHDLHPEHGRPAEFTRNFDKRYMAKEIITYLPDGANPVPADNLLNDISSSFEYHQTITPDWNKSLEEAVAAVNRWDWDGQGVVIWIGQSPPHRWIVPEQKPDESHYGFGTNTHFWDEQRRLRARKNLTQIVLFVSKDIPGTSLMREARRYWEALTDQDHFFELSLPSKHTKPLPDMAYDRLLQQTNLPPMVLLKAVQQQHSLDIPFTVLHENMRAVPQSGE